MHAGYFTDAEQHRINEGDEKFIPEYFVHYLMSAVHGSVVDPLVLPRFHVGWPFRDELSIYICTLLILKQRPNTLK